MTAAARQGQVSQDEIDVLVLVKADHVGIDGLLNIAAGLFDGVQRDSVETQDIFDQGQVGGAFHGRSHVDRLAGLDHIGQLGHGFDALVLGGHEMDVVSSKDSAECPYVRVGLFIRGAQCRCRPSCLQR